MEEKIRYMKKGVVVLLFAVLGLAKNCLALSGVISGTVTNAPTAGVYVHITMYQDTFPTPGVVLLADSVLTDLSGGFSLPYSVVTSSTMGSVTAWVSTCSLSVNADTTNWDSTAIKNPVLSLHYCGVPPPCNANFSYVFSGGGVQFNNASVPTGGRLNYLWDFGDSNTSGAKDPAHIYSSPGGYYVCLTLYDTATFCSSTFCDTVLIDSNSICNAEFSYSANDLQLQFNNHFPRSQNVWDFGDGTNSGAVHPNHTYLNRGNYTVCLYLIDTMGVGCEDTFCRDIVVSDMVLAGTLIDAGSGVEAQPVELIRQQASGLLEVTDAITAGGSFGNGYSFPVLPGTYHVRTHPPTTSTHLPTYLDNELSWVNSTAIIISSVSSFGNDIELIPRQTVSGPGAIRGKVTDAFNDPVLAARIVLKNASGEGIVTTLTTSAGLYELNDLPYGTYFLFVDSLNKLPYERKVELSADEPVQFGVDFVVEDDLVGTGVHEVFQLSSGRLYPNPSKGIVYLAVQQNEEEVSQLMLTDMLGKTVVLNKSRISHNNGQHIQLDFSTLNKGVYLLRIATDKGLYTERLIIQ